MVHLFLAACLAFAAPPTAAAPLAPAPAAGPLSVALVPAPGAPVRPRMGDRLSFHSVIRNGGEAPVEGLVAWVSLVRVDRGQEAPVDLEDWSAQKAVTLPSLGPGQSLEADWPMRLIQAGDYRVVVSAASRDGSALAASPLRPFTVARRPVVESRRVVPVALGLPGLLAASFLPWRRLRRRRP